MSEAVQGALLKYASGILRREDRRVVVVLHQDEERKDLWRARSTWKGACNHDYVDSFSSVQEWLKMDLRDLYVTRDRHVAKEWLEDLLQAQETFLDPNQELSSHAAAERVLRHLEFGW